MLNPGGSFTILADDPCLDGHFPGRPVVPGVVLLDAALGVLGQAEVAAVEAARFLRPVRPGEAVTVTAGEPRARLVIISCTVAGASAASFTVRLA